MSAHDHPDLGDWPGDETLARCRADKWPGGQTPWDGPRPDEESVRVRQRHSKARSFCQRCVLLEVCEEALSDMERASIHVEGVMAGRYSDVRGYGQSSRDREFRQANCKFCGVVMRPQAPSQQRDLKTITVQFARHMGEGLCEGCWPTKRRARRQTAVQGSAVNHRFRTGWEATG